MTEGGGRTTDRYKVAAVEAAQAAIRRMRSSGNGGPPMKSIWSIMATLTAAGILGGVGLAIAQGKHDTRIEDLEDAQKVDERVREDTIRVGQKFEDFEKRYERDQARTDRNLEKILEKLDK